MLVGIDIVTRLVQYAQKASLIVFMEEGIANDANFEHFWNTNAPVATTEVGILIFLSCEHLKNAPSPM